MDLKLFVLVLAFAAIECTVRDPSNRCEVRICTADYNPVCGSDGQTYSNECNLRGAKCRNPQLTKAYTGQCRQNGGRRQRPGRPNRGNRRNCARKCTMDYSPVCGSDGKTYSNMCNLRAGRCTNRRLRRAHRGECRSEQEQECQEVCTRIYSPVCGTDGKTYANECTMKAQSCRNRSSVQIRSRGACE